MVSPTPPMPPTRVLLVEDNPGDARLLREALPPGFRVTHLERLDDAILELRAAEIDVVLLDLSLPDSQGLATCRRLRLAAPDVPCSFSRARTTSRSRCRQSARGRRTGW